MHLLEQFLSYAQLANTKILLLLNLFSQVEAVPPTRNVSLFSQDLALFHRTPSHSKSPIIPYIVGQIILIKSVTPIPTVQTIPQLSLSIYHTQPESADMAHSSPTNWPACRPLRSLHPILSSCFMTTVPRESAQLGRRPDRFAPISPSKTQFMRIDFWH